MPIEVICLGEGSLAPAGVDWVHLAPMSGGGWLLEGGIPTPPGVMSGYGEYPHALAAELAAIDMARVQGCRILYVEAEVQNLAA